MQKLWLPICADKKQGKSKEIKLIAVWLYFHGLSFRTIAKFLKVSVRTVYVWVKTFAENNYIKLKPEGDSVVIELDEMWHFQTQKKRKSGKPTAEQLRAVQNYIEKRTN